LGNRDAVGVHGIREQGATALTGTPPCVK
jgi:hypothetical protein